MAKASDLPIVCTLTPEALRERQEGLLSELVRRAEERTLTADGLRLRFEANGETLALIARTVDADRVH